MRRRWRSSSPRARKSRERELLDPGGAAVGEDLLVGDGVASSAGGTTSQPEPQRRRERLARRAGVDDVLGIEPLQRADGRAVVAVLGVVVVLDRDRVVRAQPRQQRDAPLGCEHDAGRVLMRGRDDHGVHVRAERVDAAARRRRRAPAPAPGRRARRSATGRGSSGSSTRDPRAPRPASAWRDERRGPASSRRSRPRAPGRRRRRGRGRGTPPARCAARSRRAGRRSRGRRR